MRKILLIVIVALAPFMVGFTVNWSPVTQYTDNTAIEPSNLPVRYYIYRDGVLICGGVTTTSCPLTDNTKGAWANYKGYAQIQSGAVSDNSVEVRLQSPLGQLKRPDAGWRTDN